MTVKFSNARRAAFLAALAETGNRTLACQRARVSRSWATKQGRVDPGFRAQADAAVAAARTALAASASVGGGSVGEQATVWRSPAGEELSVRCGNGRRVQVARTRLRQWTPAVEERFLQALAECCNVRTAAAAVGLNKSGAYSHRKRWAAFAERWDAAIECGYDTLSFKMVGAACAMLGDRDVAPEGVTGSISVAEAIHLLKLYNRRIAGDSRRRPQQPRSLDEVRGSILKKLDAIAAAQRHEARLAGLDPDACVHCGGTGRVEG